MHNKRADQTVSNARAVFLALTAGLLAALLLPLPGADGRIAHLPTVCLFYNLTGLPCPGCGLTRSVVCLAHGRLGDAFHWNALGPIICAACLYLWVRAGLTWYYKAPVLPVAPRAKSAFSFAALAIIFLFGAGRIAWLLDSHTAYMAVAAR